jgi:hypothetical protein
LTLFPYTTLFRSVWVFHPRASAHAGRTNEQEAGTRLLLISSTG